MRKIGTPDEELELFGARVRELNAKGEPVRLSFGGGKRPPADFLNVDIQWLEPFPTHEGHETFIFPFADRAWTSVPDCSVDFIFHEDFIEHVPQRLQVGFLAETLRVMKKGTWHRVNTPCLLQSMKVHSNFAVGYSGVWFEEWDRPSHRAVFTRASLEEMARMVGYPEFIFNGKNRSVSSFRCTEVRPGPDRDSILGNIYGDLMK
jgi:predicted SAM-dependent methyltransferase